MRLFQPTRANILKVQERLHREGSGNFSREENLHLTLAFLGEIDGDRVPDIRKAMKSVDIPQLTLKADIASYLSNMPFLGLKGVANISQLPGALEILKSLGTKVIYAFPDMDRFDNPSVMAAMEKRMSMIGDSGLTYDPYRGLDVTWPVEWERYVDGEDLKGVDDQLWYKRLKGLIKKHQGILSHKKKQENLLLFLKNYIFYTQN